jgi:23S rRNA U2552 (ribose-2'-O)-methylase RlmE/FtsJ
MGFKEILKPFVPKFFFEMHNEMCKIFRSEEDITKYSFDKTLDVKNDIQEKYQHSGDLLELFANNKNFLVHKWHHYIPLYERYFSPFRGRKMRFLEIGVSKGGSLQMWRNYFGQEATIFGIDIDPECLKFSGLAGEVRIGSQADKNFIESIVREMGGVDVVLDDGSHNMKDIRSSLEYIFPQLSDGGIYMIEDLHSSYWKSFGGGYRNSKNFFGYVMDLVDDMHHWYHRKGLKHPDISKNCSGIHVHDSIVVLEKNTVYQPVHSENH